MRIISVEEIERERSGRSQIQDKLKARIENSIGLIRSMKEISGFSAEINVDVPEVDVKADDLLSSLLETSSSMLLYTTRMS
ncbi:MAG: hypothetical protein DRO98_08435 [Archaeoglobales archaeon]|nr:MAG: hypothetical protein DRO98_08435 [Archaeoglobales archaeon]